MDSDSSSEDEVFFGPVTAKEKLIAARYEGRKTLILPQRNALYRHWSTTHIPAAFAIEDKVTSASPSNTAAASGVPSQDCHSLESSDYPTVNNDSLILPHERSNDDSRIYSESVRRSMETSLQQMSLLTLTNSSYSSMGNLGDDERSVCGRKLSYALSPLSPTPAKPRAVTSPSCHSQVCPEIPPFNSTVTDLHSQPLTPVLQKESCQQENFSASPSDQRPSLAAKGPTPINSPTEPECNLREFSTAPKESDCILRESKCSLSVPDSSVRVPQHTPSKHDCSAKEPPGSPIHSDCSATELDNPDGSPEESAQSEADDSVKSCGVTKLDDSAMELSVVASPQLSPRFNDTIEIVDYFLKNGLNVMKGTSPLTGHQECIISPTHSLREPEHNPELLSIPKKSSSNQELPSSPTKCFNKCKESSDISMKPNCSSNEHDNATSEPDISVFGCSMNSIEFVSSHRKPDCFPQKPLNSLEQQADSHVSTPLPSSPSEEAGKNMKYGVDSGEKGAISSCESHECTSTANASCPNLQAQLESNQALTVSSEVLHTENKESHSAALGLKESHATLLQVQGTPPCLALTSNTSHADGVQSLPPKASSIQMRPTPSTQVTQTSRLPVSAHRLQAAREGRASAKRVTPSPKLVKSSSSRHTPTTPRMQQPQATKAKLHLSKPTVTPSPRATGLPPHPQRRAVERHFTPKRTKPSTQDGRHQRMLWHNRVASPLAKELRNNPPPPLVTNVKPSSSCSPVKWQPPPSHACHPAFELTHTASNDSSKRDTAQDTTNGTSNPQMCHDGKGDQILPEANYKTGKSVTLDNKNNKENIKRPCCKPAPAKEVKVIKHTGRLMLAKPQNRTSLMEVSIHQPISSD